MLERSVGLDSTYAPSWRALGERYYYDSHYSTGGELMFQRSIAALERALTLDPNFSEATSQLVGNRVERGDLVAAYKDAKALTERDPKNAMSHFAMSYVLRYAGVLDEAARECNTAMSLDPANYQLRSCSFVFDLLGNHDRAMDFLKLDMGSEWVAANLPLHYQRAGNLAQARESNKVITGVAPFQQLNSACLNQASPSEIDHLAHEAMPVFLADPDPENRYWNAAVLAACRQKNSLCNCSKARSRDTTAPTARFKTTPC